MNCYATLSVDRATVRKMEAECRAPREGAQMKSGSVLFDREARFRNGYRMAVQVVTAPQQSCWTQGVLYDRHGNELGCTDVGESFAGEYFVFHGSDNYAVDVVPR